MAISSEKDNSAISLSNVSLSFFFIKHLVARANCESEQSAGENSHKLALCANSRKNQQPAIS